MRTGRQGWIKNLSHSFEDLRGRFTGPDRSLMVQSVEGPPASERHAYMRNHPLLFINSSGEIAHYDIKKRV